MSENHSVHTVRIYGYFLQYIGLYKEKNGYRYGTATYCLLTTKKGEESRMMMKDNVGRIRHIHRIPAVQCKRRSVPKKKDYGIAITYRLSPSCCLKGDVSPFLLVGWKFFAELLLFLLVLLLLFLLQIVSSVFDS